MKAKIPAFTFILLTFGCAGYDSRVQTIHDGFERHTITRIAGNRLVGAPALSTTIVELNAQKSKSKEGMIAYHLIIAVSANDWLFVDPGDSLILLIDGQEASLEGDKSTRHRNVQHGSRTKEEVWYGTDLSTLKKIANANDVRIRIVGSEYAVERHFSKENFQRFQTFIARYAE